MTAMLTAVSVVLMYLEFPIPLVPAFLKFDFSDLPALIGSFAFGPLCGVAICALKNVLHLLVSNSAGVGELSNFILSAIFVLPAGLIYKHNKTKTNAFLGALVGSLAAAVVSVFTNYYIIYPIYYKLYMPKEAVLGMYQAILPSVHNLWQALIVFNIPFTLVKGLVMTVICLLIYKSISPLLKGKKAN